MTTSRFEMEQQFHLSTKQHGVISQKVKTSNALHQFTNKTLICYKKNSVALVR
jgi:hypothetical protein